MTTTSIIATGNCGCTRRRRLLPLLACFILLFRATVVDGRQSATGSFASTARTQQTWIPASELPLLLDCDYEGVDGYFRGSKGNSTVIPYSVECLRDYVSKERSAAMIPSTVGLWLGANPRTGSTWLQVLLTRLLEKACDSGLYRGCRFHEFPGDKGSLITVPSGDGYRVLQWHTASRHSPPHVPGNLMFQNLEREAWKTCVIRHPYGWIDTCLDFNEDVDPKLPILDGMALEWLNEQHMAVDMAGAQRRHLYLARDPRDQLISYLHHYQLEIPKLNASAAEEEPKPMMQKEAAHPWCNHFVAWAALHHYWIMDKYSSEYPAQLVYYHRLAADPHQQAANMLAFLGLRISSEALRQSVAESSVYGKGEHHRLPSRVLRDQPPRHHRPLDAAVAAMCAKAMKNMLPHDMYDAFEKESDSPLFEADRAESNSAKLAGDIALGGEASVPSGSHGNERRGAGVALGSHSTVLPGEGDGANGVVGSKHRKANGEGGRSAGDEREGVVVEDEVHSKQEKKKSASNGAGEGGAAVGGVRRRESQKEDGGRGSRGTGDDSRKGDRELGGSKRRRKEGDKA